MSRHTILVSFGFGMVMGVSGLYTQFSEPPGCSRFCLDPAKLAKQAKTLEEQRQARNSLMPIQLDILDRLAREKLTLAQACDQCYQSARTIYPRSIHYLAQAAAIKNMTLKEKMAQNLIDHFRFEEDNSCDLAVAKRLEQSLASKSFRDWCRQPWAAEAAEVQGSNQEFTLSRHLQPAAPIATGRSP